MDRIRVEGGKRLEGEVTISGAKNAVLPLMVASMLSDKPLLLKNLPYLMDITTMAHLLVHHGVKLELDGISGPVSKGGRMISLCGSEITSLEAPYDIVRKMRASVLVLGPLLARFGEAKVSLPGGCAIGSRPIDLHLRALEQMGAKIKLEEGYVHATVKGRLKGAEINFEKVSVGATENILMAAVLADGVTTIKNAAKEPEVGDLANCLIAMGAEIEGIGTATLKVKGKPLLHGAEYRVIPDRIEAGTYMVAAAMTGGEIELHDARPEDMEAVIEKLTHTGTKVTRTDGGLVVQGIAKPKAVDLVTNPYPSFPTDMQAQFMALACISQGASVITETIFENRFMHVSELRRMGADITIDGHTAVVRGVKKLTGAEVMATDLRASVSLILAALAAEGESIINRVYHLDRGYERIEEKLSLCGARVHRLKD